MGGRIKMIGEKSLRRIKSNYSILLFQKIIFIDILWEELEDELYTDPFLLGNIV